MPFIAQGKTNLRYILIGVLGMFLFAGLIIPDYSEATRTRARDARIQAAMTQMRVLAELIYTDGKGYENLSCQNEGQYEQYKTDMNAICEDIEQQVGSKPIIHQSEKEYCAYTKLVNTREAYWCIDSTFSSRQTYTDPGGEGYCNGKTFLCPKEIGDPPLMIRIEKIYKEIGIPGLVIGGAIFALFISILAYFKRKKEELIEKKRWWSLIWDGRIAPICFGILMIYTIALIVFLTLIENLSKIKTDDMFTIGSIGIILLYGLSVGFAVGSLFQRGSLMNKISNIILLFILLFLGFVVLIALS